MVGRDRVARAVRAVRRVLRWRRQRRPLPYQTVVRTLVRDGCTFEVTTPIEEGRVLGLGEEKQFVRLLLAHMRPGEVLFDIGSCVGLYALHAALLGAKVVAFEPDPSYRERLLRNVALNGLQGRIQVVEWAVSDHRGTETLYTDGVEGKSPSLRQVGERGATLVTTNSIDNALLQGWLPNPSVVKLDIEGAEILALRGMKSLLGSQSRPDRLFVELHPQFLPAFGSSAEECVAIIQSFGYVREYRRSRADQEHHVYRRR